MELMKKALAALHAAEARFHDLINPAETMAEHTRELAKATAKTVDASVNGLSERILALEESNASLRALVEEMGHAPAIESDVAHLFAKPDVQPEKPSPAASDSAPAAPATQAAQPAGEVSAAAALQQE